MRAQVNNPANGWNDLENAATAESEPTDPAEIKGNFTHDDDQRSAELGYRLTVADRDGQRLQRLHRQLPRVPARRPLPQGAHRLGPALGRLPGHAARDARPAAQGPRPRAAHGPGAAGGRRPIQAKIAADNAFNDLRAQAFGKRAPAAIAAYEAKLPDDGGEARAVTEPEDLERFGAALFTWNGGSNFTDSPDVRVQRRVGGRLGGLRRRLGRAAGHAEVPAGHRGAGTRGGLVRVGVDGALRAVRVALRPRRPPARHARGRLPVRRAGASGARMARRCRTRWCRAPSP